MKQLVGIALLYPGERSVRQRGLDAHNGFRVRRGRFRRIAQKLEHLRDVRHVLVANLDRLRIGLRVVIAVGQPEAARIRKRYDLGRIRKILI